MNIVERRASVIPPIRQNLLLRSLSVLAAGIFLLLAVSTAKGQGVEPMLHDLIGVNHNIGQNWSQQLGVGWVRASALWMTVEAQQGNYNWSGPDKELQGAQASGEQAILLLAMTPAWDQTIKSSGQAPPKNPADWTKYVEAAVSRYSAAPYNVRYFQIWNEPTRKATFWLGTNEQYVDMIYIPAAKVIRQHGCFVVFGGWPLSNSVQELDTVLNYNNAWQWTDIVDLHYHPLADLQHEYTQWVANGKCRGLWETEMGWNSDPEATGYYLHTLAWTLHVGWRDPNEFKLFWYTNYASGADGEKCLLRLTGQTFQPSMHGTHLIAMNQALGQGPLRLFTQFSAHTPGLTSVDGYAVGSNRTVLQFGMTRSLMQSRHSFSASVSLPGTPSKVQLMSQLGKTWDVPVQYSGGQVQVNATLPPAFDDCPACRWVWGYLIIDR